MIWTSANLANAIVKLVAVDALPALIGNLVMGNLVYRVFEPTTAQIRDHVGIPIFNPAAELPRDVSISLDRHIEATFQIPDVTKVIAVPDLLRLYMQPAMVALAERVESDLLGLYSQFTVNAPLGTGGTPLAEGVIDAAETTLFNANVATNEPKYMVVDPYAYSHLRQMKNFSEYNTAGEAGLRALVDGTIGKLKDFYVFRSHFVPKTGASPVTTHNMAFAKSAIGLAIRRLQKPQPGSGMLAEYAELGNFGMRVLMSYQPNTLAQQFTVDLLYGVGVLSPEQGVQVLS
jgi:hypothetical protein